MQSLWFFWGGQGVGDDHNGLKEDAGGVGGGGHCHAPVPLNQSLSHWPQNWLAPYTLPLHMNGPAIVQD